MPNHHLLSLVSALSSSASTSLCIFDDAFDIYPGEYSEVDPREYRHVREVKKMREVEIVKQEKRCECMELCFCARLDVLNERAVGLVEEGRRCLGL